MPSLALPALHVHLASQCVIGHQADVWHQADAWRRVHMCSILAHQSRIHSNLLAVTADWHCAKNSMQFVTYFPELDRVMFCLWSTQQGLYTEMLWDRWYSGCTVDIHRATLCCSSQLFKVDMLLA